MEFIDVHRPVLQILTGAFRDPSLIPPGKLILQPDHAGSIRHQLGTEGKGIDLVNHLPMSAGDQIFIGLSHLGIGCPTLPDALRDLLHGQIFPIPEVKIAHHGHQLGIGRPNAEHETVLALPFFRMAA